MDTQKEQTEQTGHTDRIGQDRTGQERTGLDRRALDRTGQEISPTNVQHTIARPYAG